MLYILSIFAILCYAHPMDRFDSVAIFGSVLGSYFKMLFSRFLTLWRYLSLLASPQAQITKQYFWKKTISDYFLYNLPQTELSRIPVILETQKLGLVYICI